MSSSSTTCFLQCLCPYIALLSVIVASSAGERESKPGGFSATAAVEPTAKTSKTRDIDCRSEPQQQQQQRFGDIETAEQYNRVGQRTGGFAFEPFGQQRPKVIDLYAFIGL